MSWRVGPGAAQGIGLKGQSHGESTRQTTGAWGQLWMPLGHQWMFPTGPRDTGEESGATERPRARETPTAGSRNSPGAEQNQRPQALWRRVALFLGQQKQSEGSCAPGDRTERWHLEPPRGREGWLPCRGGGRTPVPSGSSSAGWREARVSPSPSGEKMVLDPNSPSQIRRSGMGAKEEPSGVQGPGTTLSESLMSSDSV